MADTRRCDSSDCRNKIKPFLRLLDQCRSHPSSVDVSWVVDYYQHTGNVRIGATGGHTSSRKKKIAMNVMSNIEALTKAGVA